MFLLLVFGLILTHYVTGMTISLPPSFKTANVETPLETRTPALKFLSETRSSKHSTTPDIVSLEYLPIPKTFSKFRGLNEKNHLKRLPKRVRRSISREDLEEKKFSDITLVFVGRCRYIRNISFRRFSNMFFREMRKTKIRLDGHKKIQSFTCSDKLRVKVTLQSWYLNFFGELWPQKNISIANIRFDFEKFILKPEPQFTKKPTPTLSDSKTTYLIYVLYFSASAAVFIILSLLCFLCSVCLKGNDRPQSINLEKYAADEIPKFLKSETSKTQKEPPPDRAYAQLPVELNIGNTHEKISRTSIEEEGIEWSDDEFNSIIEYGVNDCSTEELNSPHSRTGEPCQKEQHQVGSVGFRPYADENYANEDSTVRLYSCSSLNEETEFEVDDDFTDDGSDVDESLLNSPCLTRVTYNQGGQSYGLETDM